jgi:hypothetical protein
LGKRNDEVPSSAAETRHFKLRYHVNGHEGRESVILFLSL